MTRPPLRIVLTGATRGLGAALTAEFAAAGHVVCGCGQNPLGVEAQREAYPAPHRFDVVDVRDEAAVRSWAEGVTADGGPPDLLVNNAAVIHDPAPLWELTAEEFRRGFEVNVLGMHHVLRAFLPGMLARRRGTIVNFSSTWGRSTSPEVSLYCATKFAVEGLTSALAQELPPGLAAVSLNPGIIDTDMLRRCFGSGASAYPKADVWGRRAAPQILALTAADNGRHVSLR